MWKKGENGIEGRNKRESAAYDSESNPAISCIRVRAAHTLSIYGDGICMEGKPGLMDQERCWNSFVVTSGKRSGSVFRFDERKGIHCLFCPLIFFRGSCCHNIIYICIYIDLAMCELLLCIAVLRGKSPVAWWWCRYGHYRLHIMPDVPCVCVYVLLHHHRLR